MNRDKPIQENYISVNGLEVDGGLLTLVNDHILPDTGVQAGIFWSGLADALTTFSDRNRALLAKRGELQTKLDSWFREHKGASAAEQRAFLEKIGYLVPEPADFTVDVTKVDPEIAEVAGPQLVVPVSNARFALNAANARWGSFYDALYGTDVINGSAETATDYDPARGAKVIAFAKNFLDEHVPLERGSYRDVTGFRVADGALIVVTAAGETGLKHTGQFIGYTGAATDPASILLSHHGLHIDIQRDAAHRVGKDDPAHIKDVVLEAAVTTIQDFEDSVAAVDAEDKVLVYRNWLGLINGDLEATFQKNAQTMTRRLNQDKTFQTPAGGKISLPGRSLLFARNVGIHMFTDAVTQNGEPIPEGILDTFITAAVGKRDVLGLGKLKNSREKSIYIVKPKLHGPEEVAFVVELFAHAEKVLGLAPNTLKIGIMDEERRTTLNLKACIKAAKSRIVFTNTGFLDRTGDDIHTVMEAGPVVSKGDIKNAAWIQAYEDWNVDVALASGLQGRAQIGKGMWAKPDAMAAMLETKMNHPEAGASTAWVPSPTAATLHALHYHQVNVTEVQTKLSEQRRAKLEDLLSPALLDDNLSAEAVQLELDNNAQGTLGYVARWVGQGVGCSKVPDIQGVALMEDRATLRISSQHIANWLRHGVVSRDQVMNTLKRMAKIVDEQNAGDPAYRPMSPDFDSSPEFQAAVDLIFGGREEANGYTERVLHERRLQVKKQG